MDLKILAKIKNIIIFNNLDVKMWGNLISDVTLAAIIQLS
jgi:hypothetical protein